MFSEVISDLYHATHMKTKVHVPLVSKQVYEVVKANATVSIFVTVWVILLIMEVL